MDGGTEAELASTIFTCDGRWPDVRGVSAEKRTLMGRSCIFMIQVVGEASLQYTGQSKLSDKTSWS
jgi:hypothetical protein